MDDRLIPTAVNREKEPFLLFCEHYHIPYKVITRGPNKGAVRLRPIRDKDREVFYEAQRAFRAAGYEDMIDHGACYRDDQDRAVVTFSPYWITKPLPDRIVDFTVEISPHPAYFVANTIVMRRIHG